MILKDSTTIDYQLWLDTSNTWFTEHYKVSWVIDLFILSVVASNVC